MFLSRLEREIVGGRPASNSTASETWMDTEEGPLSLPPPLAIGVHAPGQEQEQGKETAV